MIRITVNVNKVMIAGQSFAFSTQAAAQQAQCMLREPDHIPRGGNKFMHGDDTTFGLLHLAYQTALEHAQ